MYAAQEFVLFLINVNRGVHFDELRRHDELDESSDEIHQLVTRHSSLVIPSSSLVTRIVIVYALMRTS